MPWIGTNMIRTSIAVGRWAIHRHRSSGFAAMLHQPGQDTATGIMSGLIGGLGTRLRPQQILDLGNSILNRLHLCLQPYDLLGLRLV